MPNMLSRSAWSGYLSGTLFRKDLSGEAALYRPFSFVTMSFRTMLVLLVAADVTLILLNILAVLAFKAGLLAEVPELVKVTHDLSLPEDFNYAKWAVIVIALLWLTLRDRWLTPILWAIVFMMILLDDAFQVHEWLGHDVAVALGLPSNSLLYGDDFGELVVFGLMGAVALGIAVTSYAQKGPSARVMTLRYALVVAGLGFFGVGADAIHQMVVHFVVGSFFETILPQLMALFEDGGEMIVGSLALALTLTADPVGPRGTETARQ